ncbi:UNVERIFIED_CONTAM: hypothetical protein Sindi_0914900 [Sesamum indicum]
MSIRFKFRSSLNFDTVEIGDRPSIPLGELRAKILRGKVTQQQQQGFDLVFSDAVSGLEYKGDDSQIPSGSSVIVKRVPCGNPPSDLLPIQAVKEVRMKESPNLNPGNGPSDEFYDFGADLCSMPDPNFPDFNLGIDENNFTGNKEEEVAGSRLDCHKRDLNGLSQAIPRGVNQSGNERNTLPRVQEQMKLNKLPTSNFLALQSTNLPLELKCALCTTFFKEAVMIPCCQHSFCEKCIRQELTENGRCPKCFSSKCNIDNLLPNLSLRQAIEHFLESQMLETDLEKAMQKYVPDGESGIHGKDVSCAFTVVPRELELPQSSCATGKGSNQVFIEAFYEQQHQRNVPYGNPGNRGFQGENQPVMPEATNVQDEAAKSHFCFAGRIYNLNGATDSNTTRKGGFWMDSGGDRNLCGLGGHRKVNSDTGSTIFVFMEQSRFGIGKGFTEFMQKIFIQGPRNCYTCGSPDHLMRDCPISNPNPVFQPGMPGYAPPYWNASSLPPFRPYANMYNNPAMMPFNASMPSAWPWVGLMTVSVIFKLTLAKIIYADLDTKCILQWEYENGQYGTPSPS